MKLAKEEYILSKAQKIKETHQKKFSEVISKIEPTSDFGIDSKEVFDEEEVIITKKLKKKRVIFKEESDSEEEEVIARKSKPKALENKKPLLQFFRTLIYVKKNISERNIRPKYRVGDILGRFRPDGYLADMPDSDIDDDIKEKFKSKK